MLEIMRKKAETKKIFSKNSFYEDYCLDCRILTEKKVHNQICHLIQFRNHDHIQRARQYDLMCILPQIFINASYYLKTDFVGKIIVFIL